ncbi:DMT family transporter [Helicobacter pylori]|uniref:DMT family transporter n=1 Tax=Helicobacter pylori TaxID=210 RepID=UPI00165C2223|nr:DMT family transporter [Helicobacter pylori]
MTDREKFEAEKIKTEKIKTEREFYFKINAMRYDFAKQRYIALMPILVAAFGFIAFAIDKLNILHILKTSMNPCFGGLVAIIIGVFVAIFSFFKSKYSVVVGVFLVIALVVVSGLIFVESVAVIIIASLFYLYVVFVCLALHTTYSCLLDLEKYLERQAETKDCEIRKLQSNTDKDIEKKKQECENNEKKARENYEEGKEKLSYCLLIVMISVMLCVVFSVIDNPNVWGHKVAKKMTNDQNSNMECLGLTIENPKPKDSKDDTKK